MMGPPVDGRGGMSAVAAAYRDGGLFERCRVRYLDTTGDGGLARKLAVACQAWGSLVGLLLRGRVALVHVHVSSGASFWRKALYFWTAYLARVPVVLHVHGGNFAEFHAQLPWLARVFVRATFARARCVIVLSPAWIQRLARVVAAERCVPVQNPVAEWAARPRSGAPVRTFLFLGRLERDKGVFELLAAFAKLHQRHADVRLWLAGEGDAAGVQSYAQELGLPPCALRLLGWVDATAKRLALDEADAFVLPSFIEGLPVSMLEAMHCAMPVIVSSVGSVPEVIVNAVNGLLVEPGAVAALELQMRLLVEDSALAQRLGQTGRASFAAGYGMATVGHLIEDVYRRAAILARGTE